MELTEFRDNPAINVNGTGHIPRNITEERTLKSGQYELAAKLSSEQPLDEKWVVQVADINNEGRACVYLELFTGNRHEFERARKFLLRFSDPPKTMTADEFQEWHDEQVKDAAKNANALLERIRTGQKGPRLMTSIRQLLERVAELPID